MAVGAVIGALRANLSLNSAQFESGLKRARRNLRRMQADMQRIGAGVAVAGAALGTMGAQAVSAARDVQRLSQVANATPRQLQRWSAATRTVGIDQEKLSDILKDTNDRIGDFIATGGGPMADFFEKIGPKVGVTAKQFERLSGPEALQLYVSSLEKAGVSQQQMTFYMEALAGDATLLLPLLRGNGKEMRRLGDAAEQAGAVISNEAITNLNRMGETSDRIRDSFVGMRGEVAGALAPSFERLGGVLREAMGEGGALRRVFMGIADNADRIVAYVGAAAGAFGAYGAAVTVATAVTKGFKKALIRTGIGALAVGLGEVAYQFIRLKSALGSTAQAFAMFKDLAKGAANASVAAFFELGNRLIGIGRGAIAALRSVFGDLSTIVKGAFLGAMNGAIQIMEDSLNNIIRRIRSLQFDINSGIAAVGGGKDKMIGYTQFVDFGQISNPYAEDAKAAGRRAGEAFMDGFMTDTAKAPKIFDVPAISDQWKKIQEIISKNEGTREASNALDGLKTQLNNLGSTPTGDETSGVNAPALAIDEMSDAAKRAKSAMSTLRDGLAGVFSSVIRGADSARSAVSNLLDRLADMALNKAFNALWSGIPGSGGGGMLGSAMGWLFGSVPGFANGGLVPGGLTMVGERGPELVNLPGGSRVFSNAETERMSSGRQAGALRIALADGLKAEWLGEAGNQSVQIVQSGIDQYDRAMPARVNEIASDPRYR